MYHIYFYNASHYFSAKDADKSGALYSTPSTIDATQGGCSLSALQDIVEVVDTVANCLGHRGRIKSVVRLGSGRYLSLPRLIRKHKQYL